MEKEKFFSNAISPPPSSFGASSTSPKPNWPSSSLGMEVQGGMLNCPPEQLPNCFLNLNWENSIDQSIPFESALSSMVSSPGTSNAAAPTGSVVIRELIGRLGSICNSGEISPQSQTMGVSGASYVGGNNSNNNSCYSTPLNSPPKLNLSMMDHQFRGSLPISGNSMTTHHPSLAPFSADPGFAERAARFSCFGSRSFGGITGEFGFNETEFPYRSMPNGEMLRVSSSQSLKTTGYQMGNQENKDVPSLQDGLEMDMRSVSASAASVSASDRKFSRLSRSSTPDNAEFANAGEEPLASGQISGGEAGLKGPHDGNARKRKAVPRGRTNELSSSPSAKDMKMAAEDKNSNAKRCKPDEATGNDKDAIKAKVLPNGNANAAKDQKQNKDNSKPPEPPKDYIHVRARRGQATDSHSLAERVRREKISERMKFLQDLVPGCNKVTGKAVMLDEIINYVQSLQRQVEFLSMKLATVNPRLDFNMETLLPKDVRHGRASSTNSIYPLDSSASSFPYGTPLESNISNGLENQCSLNSLDAALLRNLSMQLPSAADGFGEAASQLTTFWEEDLQSFVQMGFGQNQNQETAFQPQSFHAHMKVEL